MYRHAPDARCAFSLGPVARPEQSRAGNDGPAEERQTEVARVMNDGVDVKFDENPDRQNQAVRSEYG